MSWLIVTFIARIGRNSSVNYRCPRCYESLALPFCLRCYGELGIVPEITPENVYNSYVKSQDLLPSTDAFVHVICLNKQHRIAWLNAGETWKIMPMAIQEIAEAAGSMLMGGEVVEDATGVLEVIYWLPNRRSGVRLNGQTNA